MQIKGIEPYTMNFFLYHVKLMPVYALLNILTGLAYFYGNKFFGSLTLSVASNNLIKIVTLVVIAGIVLNEVPNSKTIVGLVFILAGIIIAK